MATFSMNSVRPVQNTASARGEAARQGAGLAGDLAQNTAEEVAQEITLMASEELGKVAPERRGVRYRCVIALVEPSGAVELAEGCCDGRWVLEPRGADPREWRFSGRTVIRARRAMNLARDLRVNWPGAALALDLLDELETLRRGRRKELGARHLVRRS